MQAEVVAVAGAEPLAATVVLVGAVVVPLEAERLEPVIPAVGLQQQAHQQQVQVVQILVVVAVVEIRLQAQAVLVVLVLLS
jgi:hypothetical protein